MYKKIVRINGAIQSSSYDNGDEVAGVTEVKPIDVFGKWEWPNEWNGVFTDEVTREDRLTITIEPL